MDELIYRRAAIDECNKRGAEHIGYAIAHLPSTQPKIITCEHCLWWMGYPDDLAIQKGLGRCSKLHIFPTKDWYCKSAERRDDGSSASN